MKQTKLFTPFISFLTNLRTISTCKYYDVAAIVVDKDTNKIVSIGYNGVPSKMIECKEYNELLKSFIVDYLYTFSFKESIDSYLSEHSFTDIFQLLSNIKCSNKFFDVSSKLINKYLKNENRLKNTNLEILNTFAKQVKTLVNNINNAKSEDDIDVFIKEYNIVHSKFEIHAEQNALSFIQNDKNKEYVMFLSHLPCYECAKLLYLYNVKEIYYQDDYIDKRFNESTKEFLEKLNIKVERV